MQFIRNVSVRWFYQGCTHDGTVGAGKKKSTIISESVTISRIFSASRVIKIHSAKWFVSQIAQTDEYCVALKCWKSSSQTKWAWNNLNAERWAMLRLAEIIQSFTNRTHLLIKLFVWSYPGYKHNIGATVTRVSAYICLNESENVFGE